MIEPKRLDTINTTQSVPTQRRISFETKDSFKRIRKASFDKSYQMKDYKQVFTQLKNIKDKL